MYIFEACSCQKKTSLQTISPILHTYNLKVIEQGLNTFRADARAIMRICILLENLLQLLLVVAVSSAAAATHTAFTPRERA